MERLTIRMTDGTAVMAWDQEEKHTTQEWIDLLTDRLAAYEDTGLEPEAIKKAFNEEALLKLTCQYLNSTPERLLELAHADQVGRLVVLLCEPSMKPYAQNTVYIIEDGKIVEDYVTEVIVGEDLNGKRSVINYTFDGFAYRQECIGKTVFRTEEDAKAALEKGEKK